MSTEEKSESKNSNNSSSVKEKSNETQTKDSSLIQGSNMNFILKDSSKNKNENKNSEEEFKIEYNINEESNSKEEKKNEPKENRKGFISVLNEFYDEFKIGFKKSKDTYTEIDKIKRNFGENDSNLEAQIKEFSSDIQKSSLSNKDEINNKFQNIISLVNHQQSKQKELFLMLNISNLEMAKLYLKLKNYFHQIRTFFDSNIHDFNETKEKTQIENNKADKINIDSEEINKKEKKDKERICPNNSKENKIEETKAEIVTVKRRKNFRSLPSDSGIIPPSFIKKDALIADFDDKDFLKSSVKKIVERKENQGDKKHQKEMNKSLVISSFNPNKNKESKVTNPTVAKKRNSFDNIYKNKTIESVIAPRKSVVIQHKQDKLEKFINKVTKNVKEDKAQKNKTMKHCSTKTLKTVRKVKERKDGRTSSMNHTKVLSQNEIKKVKDEHL